MPNQDITGLRPRARYYVRKWRTPRLCEVINSHGNRTYTSWAAMLNRCRNPKTPDYKTYGGVGVTVCERWHKFPNFLADMGPRPEGKTLDRYPDCRGNYEPGNCRWATPAEQSKNRKFKKLD